MVLVCQTTHRVEPSHGHMTDDAATSVAVRDSALRGDAGAATDDAVINDAAAFERRREEARVSAQVWELFSFCFLNPPSADAIRSMAALISMLRVDASKTSTAMDDLFDIRNAEQAYYDRFFVASSSTFVPLTESRVRDARQAKDGWVFDSVGGHYRVQVERCYADAGFDYKRLQGFEPFLSAMDADSIAAEAAFMAYLRLMESRAATEKAAADYAKMASWFLSAHLCVWTVKLAEVAASKGIDYYSNVISALSAWAELETT